MANTRCIDFYELHHAQRAASMALESCCDVIMAVYIDFSKIRSKRLLGL